MAITLDAVTAAGTAWVNMGTSYSFSHTVGSGSDRLLLVWVGNGSTADTVSAVSYNGVSMTLSKKQARSDNALYGYVWYLVNPDSGAHNVTITHSSAETFANSGAASFTGCYQGAPEATTGGNPTATSLTLTVTTTSDNCWLFGGFYASGATMSAGSGTTFIGTSTGTTISAHSNGAKTPAGSHSMSASGGGGQAWYGAMVAFAPAVTAVPSIGIMTMKIG